MGKRESGTASGSATTPGTHSAGPAPGKRTLTGGLVRRPNASSDLDSAAPAAGKPNPRLSDVVLTGFTLVDAGFACERRGSKDNPGCYVDERNRVILYQQYLAALSAVMRNFMAATQNAQLDLLMQQMSRRGSWGPMVVFAVLCVTLPLAGALTKAAQGLHGRLQAAEGAGFDFIKGYIADLGRAGEQGVRAQIQQVLNAAPGGAQTRSGMGYVRMLQECIRPLETYLATQAPAHWTDQQFVNAIALFQSNQAFSVRSFEDIIEHLVKQFQEQHLGEIGNNLQGGGQTRIARIRAYGAERLAVVEFHGTGYIGMAGSGGMNKEAVYGTGEKRVIGLVSPDMAQYAKQAMGQKEIKEIDLEDIPSDRWGITIESRGLRQKLEGWVRAARQRAGVEPPNFFERFFDNDPDNGDEGAGEPIGDPPDAGALGTMDPFFFATGKNMPL